MSNRVIFHPGEPPPPVVRPPGRVTINLTEAETRRLMVFLKDARVTGHALAEHSDAGFILGTAQGLLHLWLLEALPSE